MMGPSNASCDTRLPNLAIPARGEAESPPLLPTQLISIPRRNPQAAWYARRSRRAAPDLGTNEVALDIEEVHASG